MFNVNDDLKVLRDMDTMQHDLILFNLNPFINVKL